MSGGFPKLGDYFSVRKEAGASGLPTLSVTMNDGLVNREDLDRRTETNLAPEQHLRVHEGDIAYNMMRMWQGAFGRAESDGIVSPAYVVVKPKKAVDSRFAAHWFKSARMIYFFWAYSYGLTKDRLRLYADDFCQIPVAPPPLDEQLKIAGVLDAWDRAIATTEALVAAKRKTKRGLLGRVFGPAINPETDMPPGWKPCIVSSLARVVGGSTPATGESSYWDGDIPWCTPTDLAGRMSRFINKTGRAITMKGLANSSAEILPANSVIVCSRASVGECGINTVPMATNQGFQSLVPNDIADVLFLYYLMQAIKRRLLRISAGSTFQEFSRREMRALRIAAPKGNEREEIGQLFASLDDEIDCLEARRTALRTQKLGLMQKLLTGEWRVGDIPKLKNAKERAVAI